LGRQHLTAFRRDPVVPAPALSRLDPARAMFPSFVVLLDVALVFTIFKADVRIG